MDEQKYKLKKKERFLDIPWTSEEIKLGILEFEKVFGRRPTARDFDTLEYLPTSRLIQRNFGGLINLRKQLGFDESEQNYTKGEYRSQKAKKLSKNAFEYEEKFFTYLSGLFKEVCVHEHKILRPGNVCCDFFVYTSEKEGFAIDLFYAQDIYSASQVINIKVKRYESLKVSMVFFVLVGNDRIEQLDLDEKVLNKRNQLPKNILVLTEKKFREYLKGISNKNSLAGS